MKTILTRIAAAALLAVAAAGPAAAASDPRVPEDILLRLRSTASLSGILARHPIAVAGQFGARPLYRTRVTGGADVDQTIADLLLEADVLIAEPNGVPRDPESRKNNVWAIGTAAEYAAQWAPQAMRLPAAQAIATGVGVRVAVLDTGVDFTHPALAGKLLPGRDFVDGDNDASEEGSTADPGYGHGTHVAGLVALAAPGAKIVPLRVLDPNGQGSVWAIAEALLYAIDPDGNPKTNDGARVVNMSLGTLDRTQILDTVMKLAACSPPDPLAPPEDFTDPGYDGDKSRCRKFDGAVIVAAAGNDASDQLREYPAAENDYGLVPIGATRKGNRMATFSNTGSWINVAAPGDRITSTIPGNAYGTWSGTSMAAPLAAGEAALLRERFPTMRAADVAKRIERYSKRMCNASQQQVDAYAALKGQEPPRPNCL